jgi:peptide subunit release factor 1 (eRF1)
MRCVDCDFILTSEDTDDCNTYVCPECGYPNRMSEIWNNRKDGDLDYETFDIRRSSEPFDRWRFRD